MKMLKASLPDPSVLPHLFGVRMEQAGESLEVRCSPGLRSYRICDAGGGVLGELHGLILSRLRSEHFEIVDDVIRVTSAIPHVGAFEDLVLSGVQGTFVVVTHTELPWRLYPDSGATLPLVFCPDVRRIGCSAAIIFEPAEYQARFLADRHRRLIGEARHSWLPGTLTVHEGTARLLPNHYLDLRTWEAVRFWPRPAGFSQTMTRDEAVQTVGEALQRFMAAAAAEFRVGITLTAGLDSRLMLAAARAVTDRMKFFTIAHELQGSDQIVAGRMAAELGLEHEMVPRIDATADEIAAWDLAVGHAVREAANRLSYPTLRQLNYDVILTGAFGEVGKGYYYGREGEKINERPITADVLLSRMSCPKDKELIAEMESWLSGIAGLPSSAILDLAYAEIRAVCWSTAQHSAQCAVQIEMNPLGQRPIFHAFMSVPPDVKSDKALINSIIMHLWPELTRYPVNKFGDYRDPLRQVMKVLDRERLVRYLRRKLS